MKQLAFNQGFYNLFLALTAFLGVGLVIVGADTIGLTLVFAGTGMMLAAALVLVLSDRTKLRAAAMQGTLPLLAVIATAIGVAIR
jgi:putative membrane protein